MLLCVYSVSIRMSTVFCALQLKHCSKQVFDIIVPLIKNLDSEANKHMSHLVSNLDPSAHNESVSSPKWLVCVCMCMHAYGCVCVCVCMLKAVCVCACLGGAVCVCVCMHAYGLCVCAYLWGCCVCVCVYACLWLMCVCLWGCCVCVYACLWLMYTDCHCAFVCSRLCTYPPHWTSSSGRVVWIPTVTCTRQQSSSSYSPTWDPMPLSGVTPPMPKVRTNKNTKELTHLAPDQPLPFCYEIPREGK